MENSYKEDYATYKAVRSIIGIYDAVRVPPMDIDTMALTLDADHISQQGYAVLDDGGMLTSVGRLDEGGKTLYEEVMKYVGSSK